MRLLPQSEQKFIFPVCVLQGLGESRAENEGRNDSGGEGGQGLKEHDGCDCEGVQIMSEASGKQDDMIAAATVCEMFL